MWDWATRLGVLDVRQSIQNSLVLSMAQSVHALLLCTSALIHHIRSTLHFLISLHFINDCWTWPDVLQQHFPEVIMGASNIRVGLVGFPSRRNAALQLVRSVTLLTQMGISCLDHPFLPAPVKAKHLWDPSTTLTCAWLPAPSRMSPKWYLSVCQQHATCERQQVALLRSVLHLPPHYLRDLCRYWFQTVSGLT